MFGLCGSFTYAATVDNKRTNTTEDTCLIKKVKSKTSSLKKKKKKDLKTDLDKSHSKNCLGITDTIIISHQQPVYLSF